MDLRIARKMARPKRPGKGSLTLWGLQHNRQYVSRSHLLQAASAPPPPLAPQYDEHLPHNHLLPTVSLRLGFNSNLPYRI